MILPTKHLSFERSLLGVAADILLALDQPKTVSSLWEEIKIRRGDSESARIPFDWFILAIDLLFMLGTVRYQRSRLMRCRP